jgi:S-adenosylmethionine:tRNA ribosyltransferase-isomerase
MSLNNFDFDLPEELIARHPLAKRDSSRMLYYNSQSQTLKHLQFPNLVDILHSGDVLVRNCSRVLPARLYPHIYKEGKLSEKSVEILLTKYLEEGSWEIIAKPAKKLKDQTKLRFSETDDSEITVTRSEDHTLTVTFNSDDDFKNIVEKYGNMPIPPYFKRLANENDKKRYQTVYASNLKTAASIAAPTAGLHFTPEVIQRIKDKGVEIVDLELHVGLGTFAPIRTNDYKAHNMHSEEYTIEDASWQKITAAKKEGRRIVAVGSTSVRCLESIAVTGELTGATDIYIYPGGFEFKVVDAMLTNFHLPKSSLILMIAALIGEQGFKTVYQAAIKEKYRFYSYGDCCFFER